MTEVFGKGGEGGLELAGKLLENIEQKRNRDEAKDGGYDRAKDGFLYRRRWVAREKIITIAKELYRAGSVVISKDAAKSLAQLKLWDTGIAGLYGQDPIFLFGYPALLGAPEGFELTVRQARLSAGAGFVVALTGSINTLPGLPGLPSAEKIDVDETGKILGLF